MTAQDAANATVALYRGTIHFTSTDPAAVLPADYLFTAGDAGMHTFTSGATLKTAGSRTITATDTANSGLAGTSSGITVNAAGATHLVVTAPSSAAAGAAFSVTVTAQDQFNNTATGYTGTIHFIKTDSGAGSAVPADYTFTGGDAGVHTFSNSATLVTTGNQTITATDTVTSSITGTSGSITVGAGGATHFSVSAPASATAGGAFTFVVTALDQFGNTATGYTGTVQFSSTDGQAILPGNSTLTSGTGTFSATLKTAGSKTITATDTVTSSITGTSGNITVSAATATHFTLTAPPNATAGAAFSVAVTALDQFGNTATGYTGTAHFTKTDNGAGSAVPADYTFLASDNGVHTFANGVMLVTAGAQTITATDTITSSIAGSASVTVNAAAATHFSVTAPSNAPAGTAFSLTVTALDQFNNTATAYGGTVHFTSSDTAVGVTLPANYTFVAGDNGVHIFNNGATLVTAGNQTITATDTANAGITGTSGAITVGAGGATHLSVAATSPQTAGAAFSFTVTALDQFNNTVTGYGGTVHFTSTDGQAVLPGEQHADERDRLLLRDAEDGGKPDDHRHRHDDEQHHRDK